MNPIAILTESIQDGMPPDDQSWYDFIVENFTCQFCIDDNTYRCIDNQACQYRRNLAAKAKKKLQQNFPGYTPPPKKRRVTS